MARRNYRVVLYHWLLLTFVVPLAPSSVVAAQNTCLPTNTTICVAPAFDTFWQQSGGLPVFGYPISQPDQSIQWFERNRLELHPALSEAYRVQLGRVGAEQLASMGRDWQAEGREAGPKAGCHWFPETGHNVCNQERGRGFLNYWQANGLPTPGLDRYARSLALFGLPLTEARLERGADGVERITQWFERARFEWHPQNPARSRVLLGLLGVEARATPSAPPASLFGLAIAPPAVLATADQAAASGATYVRYGDIYWNRVEPVQGERRWEALAEIDAHLLALVQRGLTPMVVVREAPPWAQARLGSYCGPVKPEAYAAFGAFMADLATRYSKPPFNIHHWEIWNEPDINPALVGPDSGFGCWGIPEDPYYGGGAYGTMLKAVTPQIKQADPNARVIFGGLLLDCDPTAPPESKTAEDCRHGLFLEGALRAGAADAFDILAYHGYGYWHPVAPFDWDLRQKSWRHRGGATLGKLDFLRQTMARYGVNKPVIMNEVSLLCTRPLEECNGQYLTDQSNYVVRLYARAVAQQLMGVMWYTLDGPGWYDSALLDSNQQPRPAYATVQMLNRMLRGARFTGALNNGAIEGYSMATAQRRYDIVWTNSAETAEMPLPSGTLAIYRPDGSQIPLAPVLTVEFVPMIIERSP